MVEDDHVLVFAVAVAKSSRNNAYARKTQGFIYVNGEDVAFNYRVELQTAKPARAQRRQRVLHKRAPNAATARVRCHRVTGIRNMGASSNVVRVQDVEPNNFPLLVFRNSAARLIGKNSRASERDPSPLIWGKAFPASTTSFQIARMAERSASV